jgi:hypothetical protein
MLFSHAVSRRLLVLCGVIPLPDLTQEEVDYLFQRVVEDAGPFEDGEPLFLFADEPSNEGA